VFDFTKNTEHYSKILFSFSPFSRGTAGAVLPSGAEPPVCIDLIIITRKINVQNGKKENLVEQR
jgi:hypothetical protein